MLQKRPRIAQGGLSHAKVHLDTIEVSSNGKYCPHCGTCQERFFSVRTAAKILDCSEKCIWNWIQKGEIGVTRFGRLVRISAGEIEKIGKFTPSNSEGVEAILSR